ncbi:PREDICTED: lens fiber major intrinsic protein-like [Papilio xuthus]|uniref:Lens fiber major intrinsic protein-like n=1 Tax=Papilio xuthus TaxID=66420 RepID=A0AAJ7EK36_PAPXU|nr:PREDICTED: lens fiber major intrinsic protein-like [Papilio xuthus]
MPSDESERGVGAWARRWWRPLLAELVATALLILLGIAALLPAGGAPPPLTHPALAFGFVVLANAEIFGPASGAHMNPAVSLAALLVGQLPGAAAAGYALAQLAGAVLGFGALRALAPHAAGEGATHPAVSWPAAVAVEAALTGVLALVCCALWSAHDASRPDRTVSLKVGLTVAGLIYAGGHLTGASLNPARSFAPALFQGLTADHWVYWAGPLGGAALGALLHRALLARPAPHTRAHTPARPEDSGEVEIAACRAVSCGVVRCRAEMRTSPNEHDLHVPS